MLRERDYLVRMRSKFQTGNPAHLFHEPGHFRKVPEVDLLRTLDMLDMTPPFQVLVGGTFQPDTGYERLNDLRSNH